MTDCKNIAVLCGSLRQQSLGQRLLLSLMDIAPPELNLSSVTIGDLALYNEDLETRLPPEWRLFRERIARSDGMLFLTPEYNRSIPAPLKNAIDVGSRPYGKSVWDQKPALVIAYSRGALGGFGAAHHLRQALACLNVPLLPTPELYLGRLDTLLNADTSFTSPEIRNLLFSALSSFARWVRITGATEA
jgi:chromate reductase, NAD(P)H dehydrogenase (quinone)